MNIAKSDLPGVLIITPQRFGDHRGFFSESYSAREFKKAGLDYTFVQDNHSLSNHVGTLRGLHFQSPPHAQDKLVRCGKGAIFDVAVDVRKGSPTFGRWCGEELSFENGKQLLVPAGFLHGFVTLIEDSEIIYKCSDYYEPDCDGAVHWNSCDIEWPLNGNPPIISEKDANAVSFMDFDSPFEFESY